MGPKYIFEDKVVCHLENKLIFQSFVHLIIFCPKRNVLNSLSDHFLEVFLFVHLFVYSFVCTFVCLCVGIHVLADIFCAHLNCHSLLTG